MQFKKGAKVYTYDGKDVGGVDRVVLNPSTKEVTHIVVRKGFIFSEDKIIPLDMIASASDNDVKLRQDAGNLDDLQPFEETHYVGLDTEEARTADYPAGMAAPFYWYAPTGGWAGYSDYGDQYAYPIPFPSETKQNIPKNTIALREGARVITADGQHVGSVKRVLINSQDDRATHFLISEGIIFKEQKLVPVNWIRDFEEDEIHLSVGATMLDQLPKFQEAV